MRVVGELKAVSKEKERECKKKSTLEGSNEE